MHTATITTWLWLLFSTISNYYLLQIYLHTSINTVAALEGENFISFNDWKRLRESKERSKNKDTDYASLDMDISPRKDISLDFLRNCDSYGEEMELDFGFFSCLRDSIRGDTKKVGIGGSSSSSDNNSKDRSKKGSKAGTTTSTTSIGARNNCSPAKKYKELEGRVYKEKFNFASLDCAATIIKTNSEASAAGSILVENKDKYLLNVCSAPNQFVVIELCEDILVEEVVMANFEYFSSTFKDLRLSVADGYPASETKNGWVVLGDFKAENVRRLQSFRIENPRIWAKYLRIEVLSHYGDEYYCPISLVRVHGKTMMEEFKLSESVEKENNSNNSDNNNNTDAAVDVDITPVEDICFNDEYSALVVSSQLGGTVSFEEFIKGMDHDTAVRDDSPEESIFKSITKRIASLEDNMTYAIMYIEEQSTLLTKAFNTTYRTKLEAIGSLFNHTVLNRLKVLRHDLKLLEFRESELEKEHRYLVDGLLKETQATLDDLAREVRFFKRVCMLILSVLVVGLTVVLVRLMPVLEEVKE